MNKIKSFYRFNKLVFERDEISFESFNGALNTMGCGKQI
jgi:hypothetical protein